MIEKEIIFDRKNYESYKDFYVQIYKDLDGKGIPDFEDYENLGYGGDILNEFLWYCHNDNIKYIFVGFDKEKIKLQNTFDDYHYQIILEVFEDFVKKYPNNELEFRNVKSPTKIKKEKYIKVIFQENGFPFIYKCDINVNIGAIVSAPTLNYTIYNEALVVKKVKLTDDELPIEKNKILTITKIISTQDNEFKFNKLKFLKNKIIEPYTELWKEDYKNSWIKTFISNFNGVISYEKDGVLTCEYKNAYLDNAFIEYTITSHKNFKTKLKYVETIFTQLDYNEISKDEFISLLNKI